MDFTHLLLFLFSAPTVKNASLTALDVILLVEGVPVVGVALVVANVNVLISAALR